MLPGRDEFARRLAAREVSCAELAAVARKAAEVLAGEPALLRVPLPAIVVGDMHGQFFDLLEMFRACAGRRAPFLFLGDYVDRGANSIETVALLLYMKAAAPGEVFLLRGNHECRSISAVYGLREECVRRFGGPFLWHALCDAFDFLPLAAVVGGRVFAVHGGIGPHVRRVEEIARLDRADELPLAGPVADFVWSDPLEDGAACAGHAANPRGAGCLFGEAHTRAFLAENGLEFIVRSHQLIDEGYREMHGGRLVSIWSAPNYCYRCGNRAHVLFVGADLRREYIEVPRARVQRAHEERAPLYFF